MAREKVLVRRTGHAVQLPARGDHSQEHAVARAEPQHNVALVPAQGDLCNAETEAERQRETERERERQRERKRETQRDTETERKREYPLAGAGTTPRTESRPAR